MVSTSKAQNELNTIKDHLIVYLVLNHQSVNNTVDTIFISEFGVIQKNFNLPVDQGKLKLFPDNSNMSSMFNNIFEWGEFMESFY